MVKNVIMLKLKNYSQYDTPVTGQVITFIYPKFDNIPNVKIQLWSC